LKVSAIGLSAAKESLNAQPGQIPKLRIDIVEAIT
jgi:hypothetical protein